MLIDEYDTPLIEAYTDGYWNEMITTCRQLFYSTLKENDYLGRAIITGVMKVPKASLLSELNNLLVATMTDDIYADCCGFTEQEVKDMLKCQNIDDMKKVKEMYGGFTIGHQKDIYNPWSIVNYMQEQQLRSYWILISNNKLIGVMEDIAEYSMSYFDTAKNKGKHAPENFYHGLVLGLIVSMRKEYRIVSNRESGEGRYDIAIYPFDKTKDAYILEFKVLNEHREKTVQETAENALKQIQTRNYEADLLTYGIPADHIYKLGFGFLGKKVWVVTDPPEKDEKDQVRSEWDNLRFR